jgi:hypothetical protein
MRIFLFDQERRALRSAESSIVPCYGDVNSPIATLPRSHDSHSGTRTFCELNGRLSLRRTSWVSPSHSSSPSCLQR